AYGRMEDVHLHGSTFGGSSLACAVARKNLELVDDALIAHVGEMGKHLEARLRSAAERCRRIAAVRGRGLVWGLQFAAPKGMARRVLTLGMEAPVMKLLFAHWVAVRLLEEGFVTETLSHDETTLRIEPALTIEREELDRFCDALERVLEENEAFTSF